MATFDNKLATRNYETNVVLDIDGVYYSQKKVDSGISMLDANVGVVLDAKITPVTFDITNSKTSISTFTFSLLDKDGAISSAISTADDLWIKKEVKAYVGFVNNNFSFGSYELLTTAYIKSYDKKQNYYSIKAADALDFLKQPIYGVATKVSAAINDSQNTMQVSDFTGFEFTNGHAVIGDEHIDYLAHSGNTITGISRGQRGSDPSAHDQWTDIYSTVKKEDHAIDILLDILQNELAIDSDLINLTSFTDIRDGALVSDGNFTLYIWNEEDALKYIEENLLLPTNCRLYIENGKISLAILDQSGTASYNIDEDSIRGMPGYKVDGNKIVNKVIIHYDYIYGTGVYDTNETFTDDESISVYGERKTFEMKFKGVTTANSGSDMAENRADRILARRAYPKAQISVTTHFDRYNIQPSDIINFTHRYLPSQGSGLGISDTLECMSRGISGLKDDPKLKFKLEYTSFTPFRVGVISPSETITTVTSQSIIEVGDATYYTVGDKVRLFDTVAWDYESDAVNEITDITGSQITFNAAWVTTLTTSHKIFFADYDDCSTAQQTTFAFISPDTNFFTDGNRAYQITL